MEVPWDCPKCGGLANLNEAICANCGYDRTAPEPKPATRKAKEGTSDA